MTTPNNSDAPEPGDQEIDETFVELISSMPELSELTQSEVGDALEEVVIVIPNPADIERPLQLAVQVPAEIAPALRAEFSPERIEAVVQALTAMADLTMRPPQT